MPITVPYNFIPLNEVVVSPYWADFISHDIPFSDGKSGEITLTLKAKSPLFVSDPKKKQGNSALFCQDEHGTFFIPGSSLRGMLRNVMEIMTFSKLQNITPRTLAVRDFQNEKLYNMQEISAEVRGGFLYKDKSSGKFFIKDCGNPGRIHQRDISERDEVQEKIRDFFLKGQGEKKMGLKKSQKSAKYKYDAYLQSGEGLDIRVTPSPKPNLPTLHVRDEDSDKGGRLVFTGQPGYREEFDRGDGKKKTPKNRGKVYEFIFFWKPENETYEVKEDIFDNFRAAYFDMDNQNNQSDDWKYWKEKLYNYEEIPVFFRLNKSSQKELKGPIKDIGLSYLYKITYEHSAAELIQKFQKNSTARDLSEAIWGFVDEENSLKGRAQVGHATGVPGTARELRPVSEILSSPKSTYYPTYLQQDGQGYYTTYMDERAVPAG
ncbi:MAG: TIGR03986 family CRISPR-associated RAMP protein, partial [Bacteroidota bacterium]